MRPACERTAARERGDRLSLVVRRPGRGVRLALALGASLILLAVVLVLGGGHAVAAGAPGSPKPFGDAGICIPATVDQSTTGAPFEPAGPAGGSAGVHGGRRERPADLCLDADLVQDRRVEVNPRLGGVDRDQGSRRRRSLFGGRATRSAGFVGSRTWTDRC